MGSKPSLDEFDQKDIPTGVRMLIAKVPTEIQPFAETFAREHYAVLRLVKEAVSILRALRLLFVIASAVGGAIVVVGALVAWILLHVEIHR